MVILNRPPDVKNSAAPAPDFAAWKARALTRLNKIGYNLTMQPGLLTMVVMVVIMCASIAWGLATLECPTGKARWGTCNPSAQSQETADFITRLLLGR